MSSVVHLSTPDCSLLLDARGSGLPVIAHWGAALGDLDDGQLARVCEATMPPVPTNALDEPHRPQLLPAYAAGDTRRPGVQGHRERRAATPLFTTEHIEDDEARCSLTAVDEHAALTLQGELNLTRQGMLLIQYALRNDGTTAYTLDALESALPVPRRASEILDLSGRWCLERQPQRHPVVNGSWQRENRRGRTGHDATIGLLVGTAGFGFRHGQVWAMHAGWSGDHRTYVERQPDGTTMLGAGELLLPGEIVLDPGEWYTTPWLYAAYSEDGIDGISTVFHEWLRSRTGHPIQRRPVVLNTWEAVYFDHDLDRLTRLADTAGRVGVERFVLDDGWFQNRRDDTAGLGDWHVDETVWPHGLNALVDHVHELGMEFGLWVEPEMVNADSDLYRAHPDWQLGPSYRTPPEMRHQQVLDLANQAAFDHVLERLDALVAEYRIDFLKWDHNRDLVDAAHHDQPGVHRQTLATYRLLDALRARHPGLEIESCSSGGGRVDLGILAHTDRVWASDSNDALDRQAIQRWTGVFLPPELMGTHIGPPRAHTTGRVHDLSFRALTATFGHQGLEWDITTASEQDLHTVTEWVAFVKAHRGLLHAGRTVRCDHPDPSVAVHGIVSRDQSEALMCYVQLASSPQSLPGQVCFAGLAADSTYQVRPVYPAGKPRVMHRAPPPWLHDGVQMTGRALHSVGVQMPVLAPEQALLLHLSAR